VICVLDSYSLLTLFLNQPGWEIVRNLLDDAVDEGYSHVLSGINYGEVYYQIIRRKGKQAAMEIRAKMEMLPIEVTMPDFEDMVVAAEIKSGGGLSYADCFAAALAIRRKLPILTGDPEFKTLEKFDVKVEWLPPNQ
jgi:predicted nucleic acid-binding protein